MSVPDVLSHQLVLWGVSHVLDGCLDVSEDWLHEGVLLGHHVFFVKQLLHSFVVTLLGVKGKSLDLFLVLSVVQHCLRHDVGGRKRLFKIVELWPSLGLNLHGIKHVSVNDLSLVFLDVFVSHGLEQLVLSLLECLHLLDAHPGDVADLSSPSVHVSGLLSN